MSKYIALLRGINVGGRNKITMNELSKLMIELGYDNIKTYIQSGNVIFNSQSKPNNLLTDKIEKQCGFRPEVLILALDEFEQALENNPYKQVEGKTCHFFFCNSVPDSVNTEKLDKLATNGEEYFFVGKVFYLFSPNGIGRSKLATNVEKCLGVATTARNLNTVNKLSGML